MVSDLIDQNSGRFAVVTSHIGDVYAVPWGEDRLASYYSLGTTTPTLMVDGWFDCPQRNYSDCLAQQLAVPSDTTIDLSGSQVSGATWDITAEICVENGAPSRTMRIYTAATLDDYPNPPEHSRNVLMQAVPSGDVTLSGGACSTVTQRITFDATSWSSPNDIVVIAWAQEPNAAGPANAYQAAIMPWPFPAGAELSSIVVEPSLADLEVGDTLRYTATGKDQNGNDFELTDPVWYTTGSGAGTFEPEGGSTTPMFTATRPGTTEIVCTEGGVTGRAQLMITGDPPVLSEIAIAPTSLEVEVGGTYLLSAEGTDQYGSAYDLSDPVWSITGEADGTFETQSSEQVLFTATHPGDGRIFCTEAGVSGTADIVVTGDPPVLTELSIDPETAVIPLDSSLVFTAEGIDQYGAPLTPDVISWTITGEGHGTFDPPNGGNTTTFTATGAGSARVAAAQDGVETSIDIEIVDGSLPKPRRIRKRHSP